MGFDDVDIRAWLPGDVWLDKRLTLPAAFKSGWVEIPAGRIYPETRQA